MCDGVLWKKIGRLQRGRLGPFWGRDDSSVLLFDKEVPVVSCYWTISLVLVSGFFHCDSSTETVTILSSARPETLGFKNFTRSSRFTVSPVISYVGIEENTS